MRGSLHISTFDPMHEVPEVLQDLRVEPASLPLRVAPEQRRWRVARNRRLLLRRLRRRASEKTGAG